LFLLYVENKFFWTKQHLVGTKNLEGNAAERSPATTGLG